MKASNTKRNSGRRLGLAALAVTAAAGLTPAVPAASAKKVAITKAVNAPIPDATVVSSPFTRDGVLTSTIKLGRLGKAKMVRDVNVTLQTLGASGAFPAEGLRARLIGPNGAQSILFRSLGGFGGSNLSIGPLTLDDEARLNLGEGNPLNPNFLYAPWAGSATPESPLALFDGSRARGTWTLEVRDNEPTQTSNLVSWRLKVLTGRPYATK